MPARVSVRASRAARTTKGRDSTRTTSPSIETPDEGESTPLREQICAIFLDASRSTIGTRKLVVGLRKIQEACCYEPTKPRKQARVEFDEGDFNTEVIRCVVRILPIKKSEPAGDRLVRFLGLFLRHASESDNALFQGEDVDDVLPETPSSRLASHIVALVLPLLPAKDKAIRFRSTQIIAHVINTLDSVDDELFHPIRIGLLKRLRDKESTVRAQAVYGLGRLATEMDEDQEDETDSDDEGVAGGVLEKLLDVLQNDPSAEVRRSLLLNLPFTPITLPFLLERARDSDSSLRRSLYSRLLPALADFRHLSLTHREKLLRWGLRDRDENVKKAAARLFREQWIEDCARPRDAEGQAVEFKPGQPSDPNLAGLLELLERIDVVNAGNDGGIALDAMNEFWEGRPDYRDYMTFEEQFWKDLTAESVFVARTFNDYCRQDGAAGNLEDKMPEITRFAFLLQENINVLVEIVRRTALQEETEEDSVQQAFIVEQLLHIALTLDYSDEIGRRTMYSLMREALALVELPEEPTKLIVEVLRTACGSNSIAEREFSAVVLEAIAEVHDTVMGADSSKDEVEADESFHSARSELSDDGAPVRKSNEEEDEEKAVREIMVNMKCLHRAQCLLQNVECNLEDDAHLVTMLNNLVIPAVRSQEAPIRERGLLCLGLCCLLDKNLAEENLTLFLHCFSKGHEALQNIAIQIIGDILSAQPSLLNLPLQPAGENSEAKEQEHPLHKPVYRMFSKGLKSASPHIQTTACTALCKLMLSTPSGVSAGGSSLLRNDELLRLLVVAYFDPETIGNPALRQALSYFLPVYCHSRKENMERMGRIALTVLHWYIGVKEEMDVNVEEDASGEMVGVAVVIAHLVDWTDGRKLAAAMHGIGDMNGTDEGDGDVHLDLALEVLDKALGICSKEARKLHISMLGKLHVSPASNAEKLGSIANLVNQAIDDKVAGDATTRNTLLKLQTSLEKILSPSRGVSRARSMAPSILGDAEDDAGSDKESVADGAAGNDKTILPRPVASPPKKPRGRAGKSSAVPEPPTSDADEESDRTVRTSPTPSPRKRSNQGVGTRVMALESISEAEDDTVISTVTEDLQGLNLDANVRFEDAEDREDEEEQITPQSRSRTCSRKAVAKEEESQIEGDETIITMGDADEGNTTAMADSILESSIIEPSTPVVEGPVRRARGRPSKAAMAEVKNEARPARKNVRAGRKKVIAQEEEQEVGGRGDLCYEV